MKRKIYLLIYILTIVLNAQSQFVTKPLNYPEPGFSYFPGFISGVDENNVWLGTTVFDSEGYQTGFKDAIHTNDGGETWIFNSIPAPDVQYMSNVSAVDANICYYSFTDDYGGSSIWKTDDGGTNWTQKTTTEFDGGYLNFFHAFNANDGVAVGDPNGNTFEIYTTGDGGDTWNRVDESSIPASETEEYGYPNSFTAYGDNIWFCTTTSRCFKSTDKGLHWTVSTVPSGLYFDANNLAFSDDLHGIYFGQLIGATFYKTDDGGDTWAADTLPPGYTLWNADAVNGFNKGFAVGAEDSTTHLIKIFFTPDFFNTLMVVDSNLHANPYYGMRFSDPQSVWLCGPGSETNDILKYNGVITSLRRSLKSPKEISIMPNPTSSQALLKIPVNIDSKPFNIRILDLNGREIERQTISNSTGWTKLNASGYPNGIYIVEIESGNARLARERWIVKH